MVGRICAVRTGESPPERSAEAYNIEEANRVNPLHPDRFPAAWIDRIRAEWA